MAYIQFVKVICASRYESMAEKKGKRAPVKECASSGKIYNEEMKNGWREKEKKTEQKRFGSWEDMQ